MKIIILAVILIGIAAVFMGQLGTGVLALVIAPIIYWFDRQLLKNIEEQKAED